MKVNICFGLVTLFFALSAQAFTDVCTLATVEVPMSLRVDASEVAAYKQKMRDECSMSEKYQQMQLKAQKVGVSLEQISEYQALRYVRRWDYEKAKTLNTPVAKIYQIMDATYLKDMSQQSTIIWDNFSAGALQLAGERARLNAGGALQLADLTRIQAGFYSLSDECEHSVQVSKLEETKCGDSAHVPYPGKIRPPQSNDRFWWKVKPEELSKVKSIVADKNETYAAYGFVKGGLDGLYGDTYMNEIFSVRDIGGGEWGVFEGDSRANVTHLNALLDFINKTMAQARSGQPMIYNKRLFTPMEVGLVAQQTLVDIHPFFEGNGRTSRFLQELVLTTFALPHGASGDLMSDDVLTRQGEYYTRAMATTSALLLKIDSCFETAYVQEAKASGAKSDRTSKGAESKKTITPVNVSTLNPQNIEYSCRLIPRYSAADL